MLPQKFSSTLIALTRLVTHHLGLVDMPDCCNVNLYQDGGDSCGWHCDDEALFDKDNNLIISLSLGTTRTFQIQHKEGSAKFFDSIPLSSGDVLVMGGQMQKYYHQQVIKADDRKSYSRLNLTWRYIANCTC